MSTKFYEENTTELEKSEADKKLAAFSKYLEDNNISIGGCGCCGSPWVDISINNKTILTVEKF